VKAFDKVKIYMLFEILQRKYISNLLLKSIVEIYSGNEINLKINNKFLVEHTINHGVRKVCPLSPTVFNIHVNEIILKWNKIYAKGITLSTGTNINALFFADGEVGTADSEENLQREVFTLQKIAKNFGMAISPKNSETMAFLDKTQSDVKLLWITIV